MTTAHPSPLLSFVSDDTGEMISVHVDLAGVDVLLGELQQIRKQLLKNDCPHAHLLTSAEHELTETKLQNKKNENRIVHHVKIYGWNDEWAMKHGLRRS